MPKTASFKTLVKKYSPKSVFAPSSLIFIFLLIASISYLLSRQQLVNTDDSFSESLVITSFLLCLKAFVFSYTNMVEFIKNKKHLLLTLNILFFSGQIAFAFYAIVNLTFGNYIKESIASLLIANAIFLVQTIFATFADNKKLVISAFFIYAAIFLCINLFFFDTNSDYWETLNPIFSSTKFWNVASSTTVGIEFILLLSVVKMFFKKVRS